MNEQYNLDVLHLCRCYLGHIADLPEIITMKLKKGIFGNNGNMVKKDCSMDREKFG